MTDTMRCPYCGIKYIQGTPHKCFGHIDISKHPICGYGDE